jgi:hypothetical protein
MDEATMKKIVSELEADSDANAAMSKEEVALNRKEGETSRR